MNLQKLRALIANDAYAITFPSMAGYRSALLAESRPAALKSLTPGSADKRAPFEASADGADAAREYLARFLRAAVGNDSFTQYIRAELAGDFALAVANAHVAPAIEPREAATPTTDKSRADALTDLLPCPFCGSEPKHIQGFEPIDNAHFVDCGTCGMSSKIADTKEAAFAAWNRRAPVEQPAAAPSDAPGIAAYRELLRPVTAAKNAMEKRGIPFDRFEVMFPKFLAAVDAARAPALADERAADVIGIVHRPAPNGDAFSIEWLLLPAAGAKLYGAPQSHAQATDAATIPEPTDDVLCACGWETWNSLGNYVDRGTATARYRIIAAFVLNCISSPQPNALLGDNANG